MNNELCFEFASTGCGANDNDYSLLPSLCAAVGVPVLPSVSCHHGGLHEERSCQADHARVRFTPGGDQHSNPGGSRQQRHVRMPVSGTVIIYFVTE